ncbi:MAG TPA: SRPBCC family protein [Acidimicrobiales bacterium]|jgi:uncharacterized protein YndB with AHSA1/START domain|nr:SRPBCC family protein [Acidimicrobiales bacterium]
MTTATNREAHITIDDKTPSITIVRDFDAPASAVYRAHTDPELFVQWVGPDSLDSSRIDRWDCRSGGEWRYVSVRDRDEHWFRGCFHEIRPDELIVQTFTYEPMADSVSLGRFTFEDLPGGRCRLTATSLVDSFEARDAFVASGMELGVQEGFRKLDRLLVR